MTTIDNVTSPLSEADHSAQLARAIIASTVGTTIEWYDFLLYGIVTGLVFGKLFFPKSDPLVGVLQAFAIYAVGFVARPIGAAIFGHYGDRIGRKAALITTLLLTGLATFAVGLRPDLRHDRHLGRGHPDRHPLHPGHRRRRRMGRLGAAGDGMGADQRPPRLHRVLAAIRRAGRVVPGEFRGAGVQRDLRRPVSDLGLACSVPAQHRHGRRRPLHPPRHSRDADLPAARRQKTGSSGRRFSKCIRRQPKEIILCGAGADGRDRRRPTSIAAFVFTYGTTCCIARATCLLSALIAAAACRFFTIPLAGLFVRPHRPQAHVPDRRRRRPGYSASSISRC